MALLKSFATLTLLSGLMLTLLPEGSLRRTASMVVGLLMLMLWADGLAGLLHLPETTFPSSSILTPTGATIDELAEAAITSIREEFP